MQLIRQRLIHVKPSCHQRNHFKSIMKNNRFFNIYKTAKGFVYRKKINHSCTNEEKNSTKLKIGWKSRPCVFFNERGPWHIKIWKHVQLYSTMGNTNQNNTELPFPTNQIDKTSNVLPISGAALGRGAIGTITQSWQKWKLGNHFVDKFKLNQWSWWCEPYGPSSLFLGVHPKEILAQMPKELYKTMFIAALFITSKKLGTIQMPIITNSFHKNSKTCKTKQCMFYGHTHVKKSFSKAVVWDLQHGVMVITERRSEVPESGRSTQSSPRIDISITWVILSLML